MTWELAGGVAAVTGAASGIGRALAMRLATEGMALALGDLDAAGLQETAIRGRETGHKVTAHEVDVADARQVERFAAEVAAAHGRVTLLVNNAGVALHGNFDEISLEDVDWLMRINFSGVVHGTKAFLPALRREARSHIVNMSSAFGIVAPAGQTAYAASKFAVRGFSEALRHELAGTNVGVSCVYPGGVRTRIAANARVGAAKRGGAAELVAGFDRVARHSPEFAAEKIVEGVKRNRGRIIVGGDAKMLSAVQRLLPGEYWTLLQLGLKRD